MDIAALKTVITENLVETDTGSEFSLSADTLQSNPIQQIFETYLSGSLTLQNIIRDPIDTPDSITILGTSELTLFTDTAIAARFSLTPDGEPACLITAVPQEGWSLDSSFPELDETFLALLEFDDAALYLSSHDVSDTVPAGLSFGGNLQLTGRMLPIAWLLGGEDFVALNGTILLNDGLPLISLTKRLPGLELGFLELPFVAFEVGNTIREIPDQDPEPVAGMRLSSAIAFESASGTVNIPLSTTVFLHSREAEFAANLTNALDAGLDGLSSLANGVDLSGALPSDLSITEQVTLSDLVFGVNLNDRKLQSVRLTVTSTQPWVLVQDAISIERLFLDFRVDDVMTTKRTTLKIVGEIGLDSDA